MKNENLEPLVYTVKEISKILKISPSLAYQLARNETFPTKRIGKKILVPASGFKKWLLSECNDISVKTKY